MTTPRTIAEYLDQLRTALQGADPALIQDALYDAEDHLRSELADNPGKSEEDVLAKIATSYGAPEEVAGIYVDKEHQVQQALRPPPPPPRDSTLGRFFGVAADPRAYAALFYMLLSLATGIFYFTWAVTGLSLSLALSILIFGILFAVLFFGTVRVLSLVEGRIIEVMLGERMPRRPPYTDRDQPFGTRVKALFTDPRSWSTLLYMLLMLPLGIIYFTVAIVGLALSVVLAVGPLLDATLGWSGISIDGESLAMPLWLWPFTITIGVLVFVVLLHVARGVSRMQGAIAKVLLVKSAA